MGLAPVSNRVVTVSDEELLLVEMQHERFMVSMSVSSQSHVMCSRVWEGSVILVAWAVLGAGFGWIALMEVTLGAAVVNARISTGCLSP